MRLAVYAPFPSGGHPEYVYKLMSGLQSSHPEVEIIWPHRHDLDRRFLNADWSQPAVIFGADFSLRRWSFVGLRETLAPWRRQEVSFVRWLRRHHPPPDVVLIEEIHRFTLLPLIIVCKLLGCRVVVHVHNVRRHDHRGSLIDTLDDLTLRLAYLLANRVLVHTHANARVLRAAYGSHIDVNVMPHGIAPRVNSITPPPQQPNILFFGVNRPEKGLDLLVDAVRQLGSGFGLTVAGMTPESNRALTDRVMGEVPWAKWIDRPIDEDEVPALISEATLVALPYRFFEAQSGVLHLAVEFAVPVVATDLGGIPEVVDGLGLGIIVPAGDVRALEAAIRSLARPAANVRHREKALAAHTSLDWAVVSNVLYNAINGDPVDPLMGGGQAT